MVKIIMPVYNEEEAIYQNICTVDKILVEADIEHGFLLVDDGSKDNSWNEMIRISDDFNNIELIRLSRNFGKEAALCAALENVDADAVIIMDSDLQHPPELIPEMVRLWQKEGYDIVDGIKSDRGTESKLKKIIATFYYKLFGKAIGMKADQLSDFKLMNRLSLKAFKSLNEKNIFFRGMSAWIGFNRYALEFEVKPREIGDSKWSLKSLVRLSVNSIVAYTAAPLMLVLILGIIMLIAAFVLTIQTLYVYFAHLSEGGFSTVILLQLFIGSGVMIGLSIIGLYIGKIYEEVKNRPRYLIKERKVKNN